MNVTTLIETNITIIEYSEKCKIAVGVLSPIFILLTIFLHGGVIYFEKFGHDPLKRNLSNMLLSSISKSLTILLVPYTSICAIRIIFGPISVAISIIFQFFIQCCIAYNSLCFSEFIVYKIVVNFPCINIVNFNDSFFHQIFNAFNITISILVVTILLHVGPTGVISQFLSSTTFLVEGGMNSVMNLS